MEACKRISDRVVVYLDKKKRKDKINGYAYCPLKYGISPLKKKKRISQFFFKITLARFPSGQTASPWQRMEQAVV